MGCLAMSIALLACPAPSQGMPVVTLPGTELPLASGALPGGSLGWDIAVDGDTLVTGWSAGESLRGRAYVYRRTPTGWSEVAELVPVPGEDRAGFGMQVAVSGDTIAVGAPTSTTGGLARAGRVYLFRRDLGGPDAWGELANFAATDAQIGDQFGFTLDLDGDTLFVRLTGRNQVHVFSRDAGGPDAWGEVQRFVQPSHLRFGYALHVQGDRALVATNQGGTARAWIMERTPGTVGTWAQVANVMTSISAGSKPDEVDLHGDRFVAVDGPQSRLRFFERQPGPAGQWLPAGSIPRPSGSSSSFGLAMDLGPDRLVVGEYLGDGSRQQSGVAFVWERRLGSWSLRWRLIPSLGNQDFGRAVAMQGRTALVGAPSAFRAGANTGTLYDFRLPPIVWSSLEPEPR